jgi:cbb3-type cytochrome oxidase subunit 3
MGKKDKEPPTPVMWVSSKDPPGMKIDFSELTSWKYWLVIALSLILIGVAAHEIFGNHGPQYRPARDLSPLLEVGTQILRILGILLLVLLVLGVVAFVLYARVQYRKSMAEASKVEREAELIKPESNGLFPWCRMPDGTFANLNAMPGATIAADGTPQEARTAAEWESVERASTVQLAAAAGGRVLAGGAAPRPMSVPPAGPPIQVIEGEKAAQIEQVLLKKPEEEP